MKLALAVASLSFGCLTDGGAKITYAWDDRRVLCSASIDDYTGGPSWSYIEDSLDYSAAHDAVTMLHAHEPGLTVSMQTIERILHLAEARGLEFVTFRELETAPARGALALAFDDNSPETWITVRSLLAAHNARVTFFVSRWIHLNEEQHEMIRVLASDGHDLQPHSVNHLHALDYVAAHGLDAYLTDEVLPSFSVLEAEGYAPTTFAYPWGEHDDAINDAVLAHVSRVRTTRGPCPW